MLSRNGRFFTSIPLGLAYLAAKIEENRLSVAVFDCNIDPKRPKEVANAILQKAPKVVGISITSPSVAYAKKMIMELREGGNTSTIPLIAVGGPHIFQDMSSSMLLGADAYFRGEADDKFAEYCVKACSGEPSKQSLFECGVIGDLDALPNPARHRFDQDKYQFASVLASRGCPFTCTYCGMACTSFRKRSIGNIQKEVHVLSTQGCKTLNFADDVFTLDRGYAMEIASLMKGHGIAWSCTTRADLVDRQLLAHMAQCGCRYISFGVESGNEAVRNDLGKSIPNVRYKDAFRWCRELGIKTRAYAMFGFPTETKESMQETIDFVNSLQPDDVIYSPIILYPGTKLTGYAIENKLMRQDAWSQYMLGTATLPLLVPSGLTREGIFSACFEAGKGFYLRPAKIFQRMRDARSLADMADAVWALALYFMGTPSSKH
jgi:radical SAM superfamily enzyme YgiQ (UPF0313 family)